MDKGLKTILKLLPPVSILLVIAAASTNVLGKSTHQSLGALLATLGGKILPFSMNLLLAAILFVAAYLLYHPLADGMGRILQASRASDRFRNMVRNVLAVSYWLFVVLIVLSIAVPDIIGKLFLNLSLFGAAVMVALQDQAKDLVSGVLLQFYPRFKVGDQISIEGLSSCRGKVLEIDTLSTAIETEAGIVTLPNRDVWAKAVTKLNPSPSPIILPPGVVLPQVPEKANTVDDPPLNVIGAWSALLKNHKEQ